MCYKHKIKVVWSNSFTSELKISHFSKKYKAANVFKKTSVLALKIFLNLIKFNNNKEACYSFVSKLTSVSMSRTWKNNFPCFSSFTRNLMAQVQRNNFQFHLAVLNVCFPSTNALQRHTFGDCWTKSFANCGLDGPTSLFSGAKGTQMSLLWSSLKINAWIHCLYKSF